MKKITKIRLCRLFAILLVLTGTALLPGAVYRDGVTAVQAAPVSPAEDGEADASEAQVHFIDVGQGDATLITCGGHAMLIDAGENDKGTAVQLYLKKQGVDRLDYLVLTHPDADHIGGADVILTKFTVGKVFMADYEKDNRTYREVIQALADRKMKWSTPAPGQSYSLGTAKFTIVAPCGSYEDPNNSSIALVFENGENRFLFTGDAEAEAEQDILAGKRSIQADVYKAGHHGSDTASSVAFLTAVDPVWAVISCGEGNSYGHPHAEVLNHLRSMGVKVFRTDEQGSIVAESDGKTITWNCAPSQTWQSGERTGSAAQPDNSKSGQKNTAGISAGKQAAALQTKQEYIGNKRNGKLHRASCDNLPQEENRAYFTAREDAVKAGYDDPCKLCKP